jgi:hypothetical protein
MDMEYSDRIQQYLKDTRLQAQEYQERLRCGDELSRSKRVANRSHLTDFLSDARMLGATALQKGVVALDSVVGASSFKKHLFSKGGTRLSGPTMETGWMLTVRSVMSTPYEGSVPVDPDAYSPSWRKQITTTSQAMVTFLNKQGNIFLVEGEDRNNRLSVVPSTFAEIHTYQGGGHFLTQNGVVIEEMHNKVAPNPLLVTPAVSDENLDLLDVTSAYHGLEEFAEKYRFF